MYTEMSIGMYIDACTELYQRSVCVGICGSHFNIKDTGRGAFGLVRSQPLLLGMCVDMCVGMRIDVCIGMCEAMCANMLVAA